MIGGASNLIFKQLLFSDFPPSWLPSRSGTVIGNFGISSWTMCLSVSGSSSAHRQDDDDDDAHKKNYVGHLGFRKKGKHFFFQLFLSIYLYIYMPLVSVPSGMIMVFGRFLQSCMSNFSTNHMLRKWWADRETDRRRLQDVEPHGQRACGWK